MFNNFHKNKYNSKHARRNYSKGVTLLELTVVIFIFMVISSITVFSYGKFRSSLSIQNLADDIALSVRRAQGFAIGVRGSGGIFTPGYGVHFTADPNSTLHAGSNKSFVLFTDMDGDSKYDNSTNTCGSPSLGDECLELLNITSTDTIESIYLDNQVDPITTSGTVDLLFKRPSPEPTFCYRSESTSSCSTVISRIRIKISTNTDVPVYKTITISNNGQISVSDI